MTKCNECHIVDLGVTRIIKNEEEYLLCPNCGSEDSVKEIEASEWAEQLALDEADLENQLNEDNYE